MKKLLLFIAVLFINFNLLAQDETTVDGIIYEIEEGEAIISGIVDDFNPSELTIPNTIRFNDIDYPITTINATTFENCTNLSILEIQIEGVYTINRKAFNGGNLVKVTLKSTTPPSIAKNSFGSNSNLKIYVPEGCVNTYKTADTWVNYYYAQYIQGEDPIVFVYTGDGSWSDEYHWGVTIDDMSQLPNSDVTIKGNVIIEETDIAEVKSFTIEEGGSITIKDGGQFIIHEQSTGDVTLQKSIIKYSTYSDNTLSNGWYTISSPFKDNLALSSNNFLYKNYELFRYNESTSMWENQKAHDDFTKLEVGEGYLYANAEGKTVSITGKPNIDDVTITLTAVGTDDNLRGFNLIGNPFMHNIYKSNFNNVSDGFYVLSYDGQWQTCLDTDAIKPMQGFLVKTTENNNTITIGHGHKSTSKRAADKGSICINVANDKYEDVAYVSFNDGIGLDKINHRNNEIPMVYVPVDGVNYAIAIMDENIEEIPVNFEAKKMGEYTISVSAKGRKYNKLTLIDKENNKEINMLAGSYTFLATANDNPARFILKASLNNSQEAVFYTENNSIIIDNMKGAAAVQVYDVMGRPVMKYNTNDSNCQLSTSSLANGVYIIQLIDENGTQVQKVIVNN